MTDSESRIQTLEQTVHDIDKRQESFEEHVKSYEEFTRETIKSLKETTADLKEAIVNTNKRMDQLEAKIDSKFDSMMKFMQSLTITAIVGVLGIAGSVFYFVYSVTPKP